MTLLSVDVEVQCSLGIAVPDNLFTHGLITQDVDTDAQVHGDVHQVFLLHPRWDIRVIHGGVLFQDPGTYKLPKVETESRKTLVGALEILECCSLHLATSPPCPETVRFPVSGGTRGV
jgi:hypothetical protein